MFSMYESLELIDFQNMTHMLQCLICLAKILAFRKYFRIYKMQALFSLLCGSARNEAYIKGTLCRFFENFEIFAVL